MSKDLTPAPLEMSRFLVGSNNYIANRIVAVSQTLVAGEVVGLLAGQLVAISNTSFNGSYSGDGIQDTFSLSTDNVDAESMVVTIDGTQTKNYVLSVGTGPASVDQIVFFQPPLNAEVISVSFVLTSNESAGIVLADITTDATDTKMVATLITGAAAYDELTNVPSVYRKLSYMRGIILE